MAAGVLRAGRDGIEFLLKIVEPVYGAAAVAQCAPTLLRFTT
jgi:hypothetical protein